MIRIQTNWSKFFGAKKLVSAILLAPILAFARPNPRLEVRFLTMYSTALSFVPDSSFSFSSFVNDHLSFILLCKSSSYNSHSQKAFATVLW